MTTCMGRPKKFCFFSKIGFVLFFIFVVCLFVCFLSICKVYFCIYTELPSFPIFSFVLGLSITPLKMYDTIYWVKEWKNEWLGEWFNGRMNEWMNEWIDRTQFILNTGCRIRDLEYFVKKGNCLFDFRRIRRIRRYKTFYFGSIVVEKDKILHLRSSFKVISRKIFQKCWCRDACFAMYYDINVCVGPSIRLIWGGNLNIVHCRQKKS